MLSTSDNPFNPYTEWDAWYGWDADMGYHTPEYLARVVRSSDEISENDQSEAIDEAIDEIINENPKGLYVRIPPVLNREAS